MSVPIRQVPIGDRPRERLWSRGPAALSDTELLALVIGAGTRGRSAIELAAMLLSEWGGVAALATASPEEISTTDGIGPARAAALVGVLELVRRSYPEPAVATIRRQSDLADLAMHELSGLRRERLIVFVIGPGNRLRRTVCVADGAAERASFPIREILNAVIRNDGVAFAVAHNHPSGDSAPSEHDRSATERLAEAARATGLRCLDHIVVGADDWRSAIPGNVGSGTRASPCPT